MKTPSNFLVVVDRSSCDAIVLAKAGELARRCGARLELFLCDAERAFFLKHDYDSSCNKAVAQEYVSQALDYLTGLRASTSLQGIEVAVSAACESPLYEAIVHKVLQSRPDMVIKHASGVHSPAQAAFDPNDWQLMRKCPVTLLMTRGRAWHAHPRFAAAVDVSTEETEGLAFGILQTSATLSAAHGCETDVLYSEPEDAAPAQIHNARAEALRKLAQQCHVNGVRVLRGEPEQTLPAALLEGRYDVLTMGALTHRPGVTRLVGTLTSNLVDAADCDFVLVKPEQPAATEMKGYAYESSRCRSE
jgi:universal stress protein E